MEAFSDDATIQWFLSMAYEPWKVYLACVFLLLLSSFGLPVPEEVTLLSAGFMAHVGRATEQFPPPSPDAPVVDPLGVAAVCLVAVFLSDLLVYGIGRRYGEAVKGSWLGRRIPAKAWAKAERWTSRHGGKVCWVFRFTPGLRFPGHLTCGLVGVPFWQFCLADGVAALVSVPTQILLIAYYGDAVIGFLKQFKVGVISVLVVLAVLYLGSRFLMRKGAKAPEEVDTT